MAFAKGLSIELYLLELHQNEGEKITKVKVFLDGKDVFALPSTDLVNFNNPNNDFPEGCVLRPSSPLTKITEFY